MHQIAPHQLWLSHVGDLRDFHGVFAAGITALVDLALNEPVPSLPREIVYCRFPLVDGTGNDPRLLSAAIEITAYLLKAQVATLVYCSAGLSRSPAIAAAALSRLAHDAPEECLKSISRPVSHDVSAGLWKDVCRIVLTGMGSGHARPFATDWASGRHRRRDRHDGGPVHSRIR